jgi:uncharacterized protein
MKITVNRIPSEGLREDGQMDAAALDLERSDIHPDGPVAVSAFATRAERDVVVQAEIRCTVRLSCARCLREFERELSTSGIWAYEVKPTDVIDLTDDVRQELLLAYPMTVVCDPACKGLCATCGQNLNDGLCAHHAESGTNGPSEA